MNAPARAEINAAIKASGLDLTPYDQTVITLAGNIAAGICANKNTQFDGQGLGEIARMSTRIAEKIVQFHFTGGC